MHYLYMIAPSYHVPASFFLKEDAGASECLLIAYIKFFSDNFQYHDAVLELDLNLLDFLQVSQVV
jgi:hypothetical protein